MNRKKIIKTFQFLSICVIFCVNCDDLKAPTVLISILARNKAHTLPYFLSSIENLNYPKNRISLWIRSDHNVDVTVNILTEWIASVKPYYKLIDFQFDSKEAQFYDETNLNDWSRTRFYHIVNLRETALEVARKIWADYIWFVDCDTFTTDPDTLHHLTSKNVTVVSPMLQSLSRYSNFWGGMTNDYYYLRTEEYESILERKNVGCFLVIMVHSNVLIDLRRVNSDFLTYNPDKIKNYNGPLDDIIAFAVSARNNYVPLNICNDNLYGFTMIPQEEDNEDLFADYEQLTSLKIEAATQDYPLISKEIFSPFLPQMPIKTKWGFDKIFLINLLRRPERRIKMQYIFDELGMEVDIFDAIDGKQLNETVLKEITLLPGYADPYHQRPMTLGEIGCFLSHYSIWKKAWDSGYEKVLILEDDIKFEPYFRAKLSKILDQLKNISGWDLVYLGRKRMAETDEPYVSESLVRASYSYWTLGYVINKNGIKKLLDANPLKKMVPVDEFLPIMFDRHPESAWKSYFPKRDLFALSAAPLILFPKKYTGEEGYVSDTEDSIVVSNLVDNQIEKANEF